MTDIVHITRAGSTTIIDRDLGWKDLNERLIDLANQYAAAGLWGEAINQWGERVLTYASAQAGARGSSPHWIRDALRQSRAYAAGILEQVAAAAVDQAIDVSRSVLQIARQMAELWKGQIGTAGLIETGALLASADYETPARPHSTTFAASRSRARRSGTRSATELLYRLYHKGHSRVRAALRAQVSWQEFKAQHGQAWASADRAARVAMRTQIRQQASAAYAASRAQARSRTETGRMGGTTNAALRLQTAKALREAAYHASRRSQGFRS